jgi:hypothetical protein
MDRWKTREAFCFYYPDIALAVLMLRSDAVPSRTLTSRIKMPSVGNGGPYKQQGKSIEKMLAEAKWRLSQVDSLAEAKRVELRRKEQVGIGRHACKS